MEKLASEFLETAAWYALYTHSRHETQVASVLNSKGFLNFLPKIRVPSRRRDRRQMISLPLFPGYLFIQTELTPSQYHQIIKVPGVVKVLGTNGHFTPIPRISIESLQKLVSSDRPYYPWQYMAEGDKVRVLEGPLAGIVGIILGRNEKKQKLVLSIELLGRSVAIELRNEALEVLEYRFTRLRKQNTGSRKLRFSDEGNASR